MSKMELIGKAVVHESPAVIVERQWSWTSSPLSKLELVGHDSPAVVVELVDVLFLKKFVERI